MDYLNRLGFNIWYDEGISVSEEWMKSIVENINRCTVFLVFITPHIIDSKFVRREISYAIERDKPFYAVYLKDTKLPDDLDFEISGIQSMGQYAGPGRPASTATDLGGATTVFGLYSAEGEQACSIGAVSIVAWQGDERG